MQYFKLFSVFCVSLMMFGFISKAHAQSSPVLYFCESYGTNGEINISDRFNTGYLTVMVKCDHEIGLTDVTIQYDKYDKSTGKFGYYKKFNFTIQASMKYVYFERSSQNDMSFDSPGFYRVFLLDSNGKTVTSSLIEII